MVVKDKLTYTADDLWELSRAPEYEGQRLELIEGVIVVMPPTSEEHGIVTGEFHYHIRHFAGQHKLGQVTAAETGFTLYADPNGKDVVLAPDVGFISQARVNAEGVSKKYAPSAPDLAVEVISPNDTYSQIARKVALYLKYGTRMVVVADPDAQTIVVHTPTSTTTLGLDDTLDGGDVLPGFTLPVREVFPAQGKK